MRRMAASRREPRRREAIDDAGRRAAEERAWEARDARPELLASSGPDSLTLRLPRHLAEGRDASRSTDEVRTMSRP